VAIQEFRELALGLLQLSARFLQLLCEELRGVPRRSIFWSSCCAMNASATVFAARAARSDTCCRRRSSPGAKLRIGSTLRRPRKALVSGEVTARVLDGLRGGRWRHRNPADQPLAHRRLRPLVEGFRRLDELRVLVELEQADDAIGGERLWRIRYWV